MDSSLDGCKDGLPKWRPERKGLHGTTQGFCHGRKRTYGMPSEEVHLWIKTILKEMVFKVS